MSLSYSQIEKYLGRDAKKLLGHTCKTIEKNKIHQINHDFFEDVFAKSDRYEKIIANLRKLRDHGRLKGTGYLSILPVDQGIEHAAGASFAKNPDYFDPENIIKLAIEGGCSGVASTLGVLGMMSRKYADKIPFILKLNHNELLSYPNKWDQILFANIKQAQEMGAIGVGATIYFGSEESRRQIQEISEAFYQAHSLGMVCILWCYLRNPAFRTEKEDYHFSADLTGQANHIGATIEADIVKQKLPTNNGGYEALNKDGKKFGKYDELIYKKLSSPNPIDLVRYQVANGYMGRIGLINSGGASVGKDDIKEAVRMAVINKRGGGMGLIMGRKAFQRPLKEGIEILNAVQDVYLEKKITIA